MKKKNDLWISLIALAVTICCYVVFYSRIASKPGQAGFWLIIAMGMATGVLLTNLFRGTRSRHSDDI